MGWFPFFQDLTGRKGLIIGGGTVALRKTEKLLPFGPSLTVVAPELRAEFETLAVTRERRPFMDRDIHGDLAFVIAASGDPAVNRRAAELCGGLGIPVNVADAPELCTFLFPALVTRDRLTVGITTGGASPSASAWIRGAIEEALPENLEEILAWMELQRAWVKENVPREARAACLRQLFAACLEEKNSITEARRDAVVRMEMEHYGNEE